jgi:hypothetical protein
MPFGILIFVIIGERTKPIFGVLNLNSICSKYEPTRYNRLWYKPRFRVAAGVARKRTPTARMLSAKQR